MTDQNKGTDQMPAKQDRDIQGWILLVLFLLAFVFLPAVLINKMTENLWTHIETQELTSYTFKEHNGQVRIHVETQDDFVILGEGVPYGSSVPEVAYRIIEGETFYLTSLQNAADADLLSDSNPIVRYVLHVPKAERKAFLMDHAAISDTLPPFMSDREYEKIIKVTGPLFDGSETHE